MAKLLRPLESSMVEALMRRMRKSLVRVFSFRFTLINVGPDIDGFLVGGACSSPSISIADCSTET